MDARRFLICSLTIGALLAAAAGRADAAPACDLAKIESAAKLQATLQDRAVEVVTLAAKSSAKDLKRLETLIAPDARFELGSGDLGRSLGEGVEGARAFARDMQANLYIVEGWDYMDMPADKPCGEQKVTVEFLDNRIKKRCSVNFTFQNGRVTSALGWDRSYRTGAMPPAKGD